jgi:dTDP-4-dehydrorhamnose 3,5-epimerase
MEILETEIKGLVILKPKVNFDKRGYFMESFKNNFFKAHFPQIEFVQDNECFSAFGVLRGLHFQKAPYSQAKIIKVIEGEVLDVALDLRPKSRTYGKYKSVILSGDNKNQLFIPRGFAHGFVTLSKNAIVSYKVDNYYSPKHDSGVIFNDPILNIDWILKEHELILSEKDIKLKSFLSLK